MTMSSGMERRTLIPMETSFTDVAAQPACTYCVLELGIARTSLPCDAGAQVGTGPPDARVKNSRL